MWLTHCLVTGQASCMIEMSPNETITNQKVIYAHDGFISAAR